MEGDGVSHDGAGYGEKHEGILTEYEVCIKVHLVCTPQERMILDHIMFQLISHQLARTLKHETRQHGLVTFKAVCIVWWFVCSIVCVLHVSVAGISTSALQLKVGIRFACPCERAYPS